MNKNETIDKLKLNIYQLINNHKKIKQEADCLKNKYNEILTILTEKEAKIKKLEQQINTLKMGKVLAISSKELADTKAYFNQMVREIDKCVALLNR